MKNNLEVSKSIVLVELEKENVIGSKATMIETAFAPMVATLKEYETEFNSIATMELSPETCATARALRLKYVKLRTGTASVHKEQKAEILREGRAIDGVKNILEFAVVDKEKALEKVENHFLEIEKARLTAIKMTRESVLKGLNYDIGMIDCSSWTDEMFDTVVVGLQKKQDDLKELERIEMERIEKERLDKIESDRLQAIETERVRVHNEKIANDLKVANEKIESDRKESERLAKIEKDKADKALADEKAKSDKLLADEKAKTEVIAKELKAKQDAEFNAKQQQIAESKKRALAPDKDKMLYWIDGIELLSCPVESQDAINKAIEIKEKFIAFKKWAKEQINQI